MSKQTINIRFQNGLNLKSFKKEVFDINGVSGLFDFHETDNPDFIIFGPYGNDIPVKGNYTRIGYFCENIKPDLSICEWAFGVPTEKDVNAYNYQRIQWHGTDPKQLIKPDNYNAGEIFNSKKHFCNFLYSHKVPYREEFFRQLSQYKKVDAPGKSMNNMQSIDTIYNGDIWERKRHFLSDYKFTIAFENDIYPGYQTEKLYDAMLANSIPIYYGDIFINDTFNTKSFINVADYLPSKNNLLNSKLISMGQMDFDDIRPVYLTGVKHRLKRKAKAMIRNYNLRNIDYTPVIERIIELDTNSDLYLQYLKQPWFNNNVVPNSVIKDRWIEIFTIK